MYAALADLPHGVPFFDAGSVIGAEGIDGIHLSAQNNTDLGKALTLEVRRILGEGD